MATRKCGNIYFPKYFMAVRPFFTRIFFQALLGLEGSKKFLENFAGLDVFRFFFKQERCKDEKLQSKYAC